MITLLPHQLQAIEWLNAHEGIGLLYADVGIGKTFISLGYIREHTTGNALIICPASLVAQWHAELEKFDATLKERVTIINYEKLLKDTLLKELIATSWDTIVLDECTAINNPSAKKTKRLNKLTASHRILLSATPFPNFLWECWSPLSFLKPGILGKSFYWFKQNCLKLHPAFHGIIGFLPGVEEKVRKTIAPYIYRIHKEDVLTDLPALTSATQHVILTQDHRATYNELQETYRLTTATTKITVTNAISMISRMRQLVDVPSSFGLDVVPAKLVALTKIVIDHIPTIVFVGHQETAAMIERSLVSCRKITGATPLKERHEIVQAFQRGDFTLLVMTSAGEQGLNLQRARRIVHYSYPWSNSRVTQRTGRAHRQGQTQEVEEVFLLATDTIDEKLARLVASKKKLEGTFNKQELLSVLL